NQLVCHHCATVVPVYKECVACQSKEIIYLGVGTQRLENVLAKHFPSVPITRIDRDTTRKKGSMEKILAHIHEKSRQILVGTQMLAKGHHFPNVTMVVIVDIDQSLFSPDFRAIERLGQI